MVYQDCHPGVGLTMKRTVLIIALALAIQATTVVSMYFRADERLSQIEQGMATAALNGERLDRAEQKLDDIDRDLRVIKAALSDTRPIF